MYRLYHILHTSIVHGAGDCQCCHNFISRHPLMLLHFSYERKRAQHPLKCLVCGEAFKERHHLTRHMTAHQERQSGEQTQLGP